MQNLTVGIIQSIQHWEDKSANFDHFSNLFKENFASSTVDLILLPEMFNTGFSMKVESLAEEMTGPSVKWLAESARQYSCQIAATLIIKENEKYYNRFVVVDATGVISHYDKRHLFRMANEHNHFSVGTERVIHELKGWRILLQVCYDLRFPVYSRNKYLNERQDYDCVIYLANWPEKRAYAWSNLLQARAIENQAYCIGINRIGSDGNDIRYSGDSATYDPWGNPIMVCTKNEDVVKILELRPEILDEIRSKFPVYLDAD